MTTKLERIEYLYFTILYYIYGSDIKYVLMYSSYLCVSISFSFSTSNIKYLMFLTSILYTIWKNALIYSLHMCIVIESTNIWYIIYPKYLINKCEILMNFLIVIIYSYELPPFTFNCQKKCSLFLFFWLIDTYS